MNARLVRGLLWFVGFGVLWLPLCDDPPLETCAYVQAVTMDSALVAKVTASRCELGLRVVDADGTVVREVGPDSPCRRHAFALDGLQPARSYHYTVRDRSGREVDHGSFRTAPREDTAHVQFAVVGDSGDMPWWVWLQRAPLFYLPAAWQWFATKAEVTTIGERIAAAHPEFVLHLGDVVYPWGHQGHYSAGFFRPFADVLRQAPVYAVLGNHDETDDGGRQFFADFHLPPNDVTGDARCWSLRWGPVRVLAIDCNMLGEADRFGPEHPSRVFLEHELAAATEPWIVVASHYPIRSASKQFDRADLLEWLLPLLREHGVDLYLSGHDHTYQRFGGEGDVPLVVSGGGGKDLYAVRMHAQVKVAQSQFHWCSVDVTPDRLRLRALAMHGGLIDTLELTHDDACIERIARTNPHRAERIAKSRR